MLLSLRVHTQCMAEIQPETCIFLRLIALQPFNLCIKQMLAHNETGRGTPKLFMDARLLYVHTYSINVKKPCVERAYLILLSSVITNSTFC